MDQDWRLYLLLAFSGVGLLLLILLLRRSGETSSAALERVLRDELRAARDEQAAAARALREEVTASLRAAKEETLHSLTQLTALQQAQLESMTRRLAELTGALQVSGERLSQRLSDHLQQLQDGNEKKLEEMRVTVDEKLHGTLERRLGESFALVSERLEAVQRGLGEMQSLANGVGDLKRVLTNVKARGVWGEYQLQAILEQMLTPDQYCANYRPRQENGVVVEFAIRLPGREPGGDPVYLPIDSKFPQEDYQRLLDAADRADAEALHYDEVATHRRSGNGRTSRARHGSTQCIRSHSVCIFV